MGLFSKSSEYAMRAVFYIAQKSQMGEKVGIKEIAAQIQSPEPFLAKILQSLSRNELVRSAKGPNGGFYFDENGLNAPLINIVLAIEGQNYLTDCAMGLQKCSEKNPCPLHFEFKEIRTQLKNLLTYTSIGQFNEELKRGTLHLV